MIDGKYNLLGYFDTITDNLTWFSKEQWVGGMNNRIRSLFD